MSLPRQLVQTSVNFTDKSRSVFAYNVEEFVAHSYGQFLQMSIGSGLIFVFFCFACLTRASLQFVLWLVFVFCAFFIQ